MYWPGNASTVQLGGYTTLLSVPGYNSHYVQQVQWKYTHLAPVVKLMEWKGVYKMDIYKPELGHTAE